MGDGGIHMIPYIIASVKDLSDASSLDHSKSLVHAPGVAGATQIMIELFHISIVFPMLKLKA